jgi:hypothetical protein
VVTWPPGHPLTKPPVPDSATPCQPTRPRHTNGPAPPAPSARQCQPVPHRSTRPSHLATWPLAHHAPSPPAIGPRRGLTTGQSRGYRVLSARCAHRPGRCGYLSFFARCAPATMDCMARAHPTNSPRGHPPEGSWHGLALSGTSRAPPRTAYLPDCQPANGPPGASVRQCRAGPTRPTRPSRPARSRRSRNQESRRRPFGVGNGRRGGALGRRADPSSTTALPGERTPSGAAGLQGWLDTTCHWARRAKTLGVSSTWSYRGRAATKELTAPEVGVGDPSAAPRPSHLPACHLLGK